MHNRCYNSKHPAYHRYGGRGILICPEWHDINSFILWSYKNRFGMELTIDRINNDLGYFPNNCRWVTLSENARNTSNNHLITAFGETKCLQTWLDDARCNLKFTTLRARLLAGWDAEKAISEPLKRSH